MAYGQSQVAIAHDERRRLRRVVVDCAATFETHTAERAGRLTDLSEAGARFEGDELPRMGTSGLVRWADQEHFAQVIWHKDGACGLQFERVIPTEVVQCSAEVVEEALGPVAKFGNIPLGRKRSRRAALIRSVDGDDA